MRRMQEGCYRIKGVRSGRTYLIRRRPAHRLGWLVETGSGAWYKEFASLPHARAWVLEN